MRLTIQTIEKTLYAGPILEVTMPTESGEISVLPGHANLVTALRSGKITVRNEKGEESFALINGGFADIKGDSVNILAK